MKDNSECVKMDVFLMFFFFYLKTSYDDTEFWAQFIAICAQPPHSLKPQSFQKEEELFKQT